MASTFSNVPSFIAILNEALMKFFISCELTLSSCTPFHSDTFVINSGVCCTSKTLPFPNVIVVVFILSPYLNWWGCIFSRLFDDFFFYFCLSFYFFSFRFWVCFAHLDFIVWIFCVIARNSFNNDICKSL